MKHGTHRSGVFTRRALLVMGAQATLLGGVTVRLYQMQVVDGERYATLAEGNRISARLIAPPRGRMLDRFGIVLAGNRLNWRALLVAEQTTDLAATLDNFARIVPLADYERLRIDREVRRHRRFIPVMVREFLSWDEMAAIEVNAPDLPGILVDVGTTRIYPLGEQFAISSATWRRRARRTSPMTPRLRCPASGWAARGWRSSTTSICAGASARCRSR
jgi:penicillin-binding protein 2